jgi:hypothetical protein
MKNESAVVIPWTKEGHQRFVQLLQAVGEERKTDKEKNEDSLELLYMREVKARMDEVEPERKRQKLRKEDEDVEMPVLDFSGVSFRVVGV